MIQPAPPALLSPAPPTEPLDPSLAAGATGTDPSQMLELVNALVEAFELEAEQELRPLYPPWYDESYWPKPADEGKLLTECRQLHGEFTALRNRFYEDKEFLKGNRKGVFTDASESEKQHAFFDPSAQAENELVISQVAALTPTYMPQIRQRADMDEAADKVDFLLFCDDEAQRQHAAAGNGSLAYDTARLDNEYGRIAYRILPNLDAGEGESPFREHLLDPATCCPVFEQDRGLCKMIRVFRTTVSDVCASYNFDGKIEQKLEKIYNRDYKQFETCEVIEYWDRRWYVVFINGSVILGPTEHRLGRPPFIYKIGNLGEPAFLRDPLTGAQGIAERPANELSFEPSVAWRDAAMPNKGVSHIHLLKYPHQLREAIMTRTVTHFRRNIDPAMVVAQDHIAEKKGVPEIDRDPNAVSKTMRDHEEIQVLPSAPQAESLGPLLQMVNEGYGRLTMPPTAYGINVNSNVSGYAVDNLNESGRDKILPHILTLRDFYQERAELRLILFRDWGWMLGQGNERGFIYVPRQRPTPTQDPQFKLTPGDIRRTGVKVNVTLTGIKLQSLGPLGQAVSLWRSMNLMTRERALELQGDPNPLRTIQELDAEMITQDPVITEANMIEWFRRNGMAAVAAYIEERKKQAGQGGGGAPPSAAAPPPPGLQGGVSLPQFGQGPGPGSGPQGPVTPPPFPGTEP